MKKRVLLLGLVVLMVLTGCGTTEKETKTKEKDPDKSLRKESKVVQTKKQY